MFDRWNMYVLPISLYLDIGQTFKPQGLELDVYIPRRQFNKDQYSS